MVAASICLRRSPTLKLDLALWRIRFVDLTSTSFINAQTHTDTLSEHSLTAGTIKLTMSSKILGINIRVESVDH